MHFGWMIDSTRHGHGGMELAVTAPTRQCPLSQAELAIHNCPLCIEIHTAKVSLLSGEAY
jgi:hypothetical protein